MLHDQMNVLSRDSPLPSAKILDSHELITTLRSAFIFGISQGGAIPLPLEFITISLVRIMERHLLVAYARKAGQLKLLYTLMLLSWAMLPVHWVFSLLVIGGLAFFGWSSRDLIKQARELAMLPFESQNADHYTGRLDSFLCGLVCCSLGNWAPWYTAVVLISVAPLIMIEVERFLSALTDQRAVRYIRKALAMVSECMAVYLALYSTTLTFLMLWNYFPTIMRWATGGTLMLLEMVLRYPGKLHDLLFSLNSSFLMQLVRFAFGIIVIYWLFAPFEYKDLVFGLPLVAFVFPPTLRRYVAVLLHQLGALLIALRIDIFQALRFSLVAGYVVAALSVVAWRYVLVKLRLKPAPREE